MIYITELGIEYLFIYLHIFKESCIKIYLYKHTLYESQCYIREE